MDNVYEAMEAAEMLLLPDLKRQCGMFLSEYLETSNVVDLLRTSRLFDIPRLEHQCVEFVAANIEEVDIEMLDPSRYFSNYCNNLPAFYLFG